MRVKHFKVVRLLHGLKGLMHLNSSFKKLKNSNKCKMRKKLKLEKPQSYVDFPLKLNSTTFFT